VVEHEAGMLGRAARAGLVERAFGLGSLERTDVRFANERDLREVIEPSWRR
jgi:hypothetical protein